MIEAEIRPRFASPVSFDPTSLRKHFSWSSLLGDASFVCPRNRYLSSFRLSVDTEIWFEIRRP